MNVLIIEPSNPSTYLEGDRRAYLLPTPAVRSAVHTRIIRSLLYLTPGTGIGGIVIREPFR